jgi:hypothetical protein
VSLNLTRDNESDSGSSKIVVHLTPVKLGNQICFCVHPGPLPGNKATGAKTSYSPALRAGDGKARGLKHITPYVLVALSFIIGAILSFLTLWLTTS